MLSFSCHVEVLEPNRYLDCVDLPEKLEEKRESEGGGGDIAVPPLNYRCSYLAVPHKYRHIKYKRGEYRWKRLELEKTFKEKKVWDSPTI